VAAGHRAHVSVLAIDTSARGRCVCVTATRDGVLLRGVVRTDAPLDALLPDALATLLDAEVEAVVVAVGPGSYTGLRGGMAAALGVAQARELPIHGIGSLAVVAAAEAPGDLEHAWIAADAGRGGLWLARAENVSGAWRLAPPRRVPLQDFDPAGVPILSVDALPLDGVRAVDPATALARAVPVALSTRPLSPAGLHAVYE
jgi:tRNA threonylcarbamoyladenosine biosynthesis protein TsaB